MTKALLICNLGVSTKMLKEKIETAFAGTNEGFYLMAQPRSNLEELIEQIDLVLIAPQITYLKDEIIQLCSEHNKKWMVIPFKVYGIMDGKAVADLIRQKLAE